MVPLFTLINLPQINNHQFWFQSFKTLRGVRQHYSYASSNYVLQGNVFKYLPLRNHSPSLGGELLGECLSLGTIAHYNSLPPAPS